MTGNVTGTVSDLSNQDTDALSEGTTNLYYTDARAKAAITAGTGVTVSSGEVSIGQAVGTTSDVTFNSVTGNLTGNVTGTVGDLSNQDTDALSEGTTNLYYTDARAKDLQLLLVLELQVLVVKFHLLIVLMVNIDLEV